MRSDELLFFIGRGHISAARYTYAELYTSAARYISAEHLFSKFTYHGKAISKSKFTYRGKAISISKNKKKIYLQKFSCDFKYKIFKIYIMARPLA